MKREYTWQNKPDEYYPPKIMHMPGCIATVYRPILTPEERERRMKKIYESAASLIESHERAMREREASKSAE